jgi:ferrous iron transport protein B
MRLADLKNGEEGIILKVRGRGAFRKRIMDMGFIKGKSVRAIKNAPLRDPIEYKLMDYNVSLRRNEAKLVEILAPETSKRAADAPAAASEGRAFRNGDGPKKRSFYTGADSGALPGETRKARRIRGLNAKTIRLALVGNPNSGKTTIFNYASGSRERVGNYGGVTIGAKEARFEHEGYLFIVTDLPGTYSITEYTPEEIFVRNAIIQNRPDVIVNILDASNLERNLYLTTQLIEMNLTVVAALNMYDELQKKGDVFDYDTLGKMLGIPFVPTVGPKGEGMSELFAKIIDVYERREKTVRKINVNYGQDIERAVASIEAAICEACGPPGGISSRYAAIKLLEKDADTERLLSGICEDSEKIFIQARKQVSVIEAELKEDSQTLIADARYGFIAGALKETYRRGVRPEITVSERIDSILTHQILGVPIFLLFLWIAFQCTFSLGKYPMDWIQAAVAGVSLFMTAIIPPGLFRELITDGIIPGVGGVIVFVPNILILFFMISLMEDTGYMARAAFIMDRLMHSIGLHGKSFIPLILGFGCNVPAIMATRTLESRKDRLLTMLIIPFMSCSARLPVFVLFISAFFPSYAGSMLLMLYLSGIAVAVFSAIIMKKTVFRESEVPFVMELPPYRVPHLRNTLRHMWERAKEYFKKIGGIILIAAVLIWALGRFPEPEAGALIDEGARLEQSYIGRMGKFVMPVLDPLGFDWKMGVSLITGLAAKEITVSTLGILYRAEKHPEGGNESLMQKIREERHTSGPHAGERVFDPLSALGYMVFILLYVPCAAALVTIRRESGALKWPVFSAFFSISMAWIAAFLIHTVGMLLR